MRKQPPLRDIVLRLHIMLRDELTQKSIKVKMVFGFEYPRASRFRKTKPINQFRSLKGDTAVSFFGE
jgi:hypothetical protein